MTTLRALLFDFGGTLDQPIHWLDRFLAYYRACGLELDRAQLEPAYDCATKTAYGAVEAMRERGLSETVRFLVGLQLDHLSRFGPEHVREELTRVGQSGNERLRDRISAAFSEESFCGMARSREVLLVLSSRFRLGVVSNFYGNLDRVLAEARLSELMDVTVDSAKVGIFKPDPRIFGEALDALGFSAQPAQAAMVGDSPVKDCAPAHRAGLKTIWLCGPDRLSGDLAEGFADHKIHTIDELLKLECLKM